MKQKRFLIEVYQIFMVTINNGLPRINISSFVVEAENEDSAKEKLSEELESWKNDSAVSFKIGEVRDLDWICKTELFFVGNEWIDLEDYKRGF